MEALLRELSLDPGMASTSKHERVSAFEKILIDGMNGLDIDDENEASGSSTQAQMGPAPPPSAASPTNEDAFQRSIRQAMEKLKQSDSTLQVDTSIVIIFSLLMIA